MSDQAAFQEVDDAVRQDDLKAWWNRYGTWLVGAAVVGVVAVAGLVGWRQYDAAQRATAGAAYSAALAKIGPDNAGARAELDKQAASAPEPYRSLAALAAAQLRDTAVEQVAALEAVAPKLPAAELTDLAQVIAAFRSLGTDKADATIAGLEPLASPERPFHTSVIELQALAAARKGDLKKARDIWNEIVKDQGAPQGAVQRAQSMLNLYAEANAAKEAK
ncbi:MAG: tetratricopeptide repeat protein [Reyranellales bacterium]